MNVLFVDDEPNLLRAYERLFRKYYTLHTAVGAQEGLAMLKQYVFGVIVSDMRMPGMNGVEFLAQARLVSPNSVQILLTGNPTEPNHSGTFRCLQKPCPRSELLAVLQEAEKTFEAIQAGSKGTAPLTLPPVGNSLPASNATAQNQ
jgi:DNA-binding NtrC family response regulator